MVYLAPTAPAAPKATASFPVSPRKGQAAADHPSTGKARQSSFYLKSKLQFPPQSFFNLMPKENCGNTQHNENFVALFHFDLRNPTKILRLLGRNKMELTIILWPAAIRVLQWCGFGTMGFRFGVFGDGSPNISLYYLKSTIFFIV